MKPAPVTAVDEITASLRAEDARLRRRTLWLTLAPVLVGLVVLGSAWWGVQQARREKAVLDAQLAQQQGLIDGLQRQRAAIDAENAALAKENAGLGREIAARRDLLDHYARWLPKAQRERAQELQQGLAQAQLGDGAAALRAFDNAIAADDRDSLAWRLRGSALYAQGDYDAADRSLRTAIARAPDDAQARYMLGLALWAQGKQAQALAEVERAFADPEVRARALQDPAFSPLRAALDARSGQQSASDSQAKAAIDAGLQAARRGDFATAVTGYDQALAIEAANPKVWTWRGYALYRQGRFDDAIASYERALALDPQAAETLYNLALARWKTGDRAQAQQALTRAYAADPAFEAIASRDPQSRELRAARKP